MTTTTTRTRRLTGLTLIALAMGAVLASAQDGADRRPGMLGTRANQGLITTEGLSPLRADTAPERAGRVAAPSSGWSAMFTAFHPGSCSMSRRLAPPSSWPARGEPAVKFCQRPRGLARPSR